MSNKNDSTVESRLLKMNIALIHAEEDSGNYDRRNELVLQAMYYASKLGYDVGIRIDKDEPSWPVVYIELPTGQVSWHLPQHIREWDGHTTKEKYERCLAYSKIKILSED